MSEAGGRVVAEYLPPPHYLPAAASYLPYRPPSPVALADNHKSLHLGQCHGIHKFVPLLPALVVAQCPILAPQDQCEDLGRHPGSPLRRKRFRSSSP